MTEGPSGGWGIPERTNWETESEGVEFHAELEVVQFHAEPEGESKFHEPIKSRQRK